MKICPKCGYKDSSCWRVGLHMLYSDMEITRITELELWEPELTAQIKKKKGILLTKYYAYKLTKKGWVYRRDIALFRVAGFSKAKAEKYVKPPHPNQTKLIEEKKKC